MPFETPSGETLWLLVASMPEPREDEFVYNGVILDITERKERERVLKDEQEALQSMYRITADSEASLGTKVRRLLALGRDHLGLPYGVLARPSEGTFEILCAAGDHPRLEEGTQSDLAASYCRWVIQHERLLAVQDADAEGWGDALGDGASGFEAYVGAPVLVDGEPYGTCCFVGEEAKEKPFTERERTFVELMAQWISYELERRRAQARLKHQNERLDSFARLVAHDLRNPLNVAMGRLQMAREGVSGDHGEGDGALTHLTAVGQALDRMEALINDVLSLTWGGQTIEFDDLSDCDLKQVVEASWDHVDTVEARLQVRGVPVVKADRGRLQRLLENLFRNAVEHAGESVTVEVGSLDDGFYVADDGPGIPPEEREAVFEEGYSSEEAGTGLGLSIVQAIAEAHGWTLSVTESDAGGARFEVRGVETIERIPEEG